MNTIANFPKLIFVAGSGGESISLEKDITRIYSVLTDLPPSRIRQAEENISLIQCYGSSVSSPEAHQFLEAAIQSAEPGVKVIVIAMGEGSSLVQRCLSNPTLENFIRGRTANYEAIIDIMKDQLIVLAIDGLELLSKDLAKTAVNIKTVEGPCCNDGVLREKYDGRREYIEAEFSKPGKRKKSKNGFFSSASASAKCASSAIAEFLLQEHVIPFLVGLASL